MAQAASFSVILEAQNNLKAVLNQANGMIRQSTDELKKASAAQSKMGSIIDDVKAKVFSFRGGLVALGSAAVAASKPLFDFAMQGAKLADQLDFVSARVGNMDQLMAQAREATGGMVDDAQLAKGIALMDSFGLELDKMPELYEQAAKASLRTGDSMDILLDSAVRGIARLSPRIIDNMGIQVELSEATQVAADMFGIEADAVDETQKKAGLLSVVLRELGKLNRDVDLNKSRVASLKSVSTAFTNFKNTLAKDWADLFTSTGDRLEEFAHQSKVALNKADDAWARTEDNIRKRIANIGTIMDSSAKLNLTVFREQALVQEEMAARRELEAEQLARAGMLEAKINTELINQRVLMLEKGKWRLFDQEQLEKVTKRITLQEEERNRKETAALKARFQARRLEEQERSKADRARIKDMTEMTRIAMGESQAQINLENQKELVNKLRKEGKGLEDGTLAAAENLLVKYGQIVDKQNERKGASRSIKKSEEDNTQELLAQIEALERKNKLAAEGDPRRKAELKSGFALLDMLKEAEKFEEKGLDAQFLKAKFTALELQHKQDIANIDADDAEARFRVRMAQHEVDLLQEITEEDHIRLELQAQIAEINHTTLAGEERRLLIKAAEIDATTQLRDLEQERLEANMATLGEGVGEAFDKGSRLLKDMDKDLKALNREERFTNVIEGFQGISAALPKAAEAFSALGDSSLSAGDKVAGGIAAGLGAIGPSVAGFVNGTREKAAIMAAFELAMGFATIMTPWESAAHFAAAAMFGVIAGTAASMPTTAVAEEETPGAGDLITPAAERPREDAPASFTINLGPGTIFGLPQEMGAQIAERINSMSGSGFEESTAF